MPTLQVSQKTEITYLYQSGLSVRLIAEKYNVSIDAMYYFFRKHAIKRRTASQNNQLFFEKKENSFQIKNIRSRKEETLRIAGLMLYWGEGSQWSRERTVDFANCKPEMVKVFLAFLREVCGVEEKKLRVYLYCYSDQKVEDLLGFWSKVTKIPRGQFTKPYIRQDFNKEKSGKMPYGLVHIRYSDKHLLLQLKEWIKDFAVQY